MAQNFITNHTAQHTLKSRLNTLISVSPELKFLVGFFYFSGWEALYQSLKKNQEVHLKLLVGLQVDEIMGKMTEHEGQNDGMSQDDHFNRFMSSMHHAINNVEMDTEAFYNQVSFFLQMITGNRLLIRKTENSNHAKLYLFRYNEKQAGISDREGEFITGSSNLTRAGLSGQEEFNVEIKDYGFSEAESYFDDLWSKAIPISEEENRKQFLIRFIQHRSQAATVTPYEAYALILKTYLDLRLQKHIKPEVEQVMEEAGYKKFSYQTDAVNQALSIMEEYHGVIIADVVGLGKSVIASLIAKNIGKRGMVICPPALIGNKSDRTGWWGYIQDFKLYDWEVESGGKLTEIAENIDRQDIEVLIIDEAHKFRNQDTEDYEALLNICRNRTVILLTATPFNNSPADIFSLLKLFIIPGKSGITLEDNLEGRFRAYNYRFNGLSFITKNYNSTDPKKVRKAETLYLGMLGLELPIDIHKVRAETQRLANQIKNVISPVVIRRNRLDLKSDFQYSTEINELSKVRDPEELYFFLTKEQNTFYDKILNDYFDADHGRFKGAIYQPFIYEKIVDDPDDLDEEGNRQYQQQRNLFDFMRRLLVKRFESSFGAFSDSIERFLKVHEIVQSFIKQSNGKFILDRKLIEKIYELDPEEIEEELERFEMDLQQRNVSKNNKVYEISKFQRKQEFMDDIENDKQLFMEIKEAVQRLDLVHNDPKREAVYSKLKELLDKEPNRKIIIFSEYVDTVRHLRSYLEPEMKQRLLVCEGEITREVSKKLNSDFNAQYKAVPTNYFDVLLTSDKLSEGVNLNRAGVIINYDIPWNPTRVIQRVGRINRIGAKVYDELYIYNFFPSEKGSDIVKSREIAAQKMFLIHNALGEDAKIFDEDEEPTPSGLFKKINKTPDEDGEPGIGTLVRNSFQEIQNDHPAVLDKIAQLPARVKSAKIAQVSQLNVLRKKGLSLFVQTVKDPSAEKNEVEEILFEELLPAVRCEINEERVDLSKIFWVGYETIKHFKPQYRGGRAEMALETKARNSLKVALHLVDPTDDSIAEFIKILLRDIEKYHTLSSRTLGRIGRKELNRQSNEKEQESFFKEIQWIRNQLGMGYLDEILKRIAHQKEEVIIAVENRKETSEI